MVDDKTQGEGKEGGADQMEEYGEDFYHEIGQEGDKPIQERGTAHELTNEERKRGGQHSHGGGRPRKNQ